MNQPAAVMTEPDELEGHPLANLFPLIVGRDFDVFVTDIRANGQIEPIMLLDGMILDGRNRYRACREIGIAPRCIKYLGTDPLAYVIAKNLPRRHLKESQRAMIAARLATLKVGQHPDPASKTEALPIGRALSVEAAARMLNVGPHSVSRARSILDQGTPAEIQAVQIGGLSLAGAVQQIRAREPAKKHQERKRKAKAGKWAERRVRDRALADLWGKLRTALLNLSEMPNATEVAAMLDDRRGKTVEEALSKAERWMREFADAWRNRDQA